MTNAPTLADASTPSLDWSIDSSQAGNAGNSQSIASRHAFATNAGTVDYQATMPTSGSRYYGAVLFTIKKP